MSAIIVAQSGNGLMTVSVTQDDVANTWTDIQVVNNDTTSWLLSGDIQAHPFSINVPAGTNRSHVFSPALPLITITNFKGQQVLVPSLNGTTPVAYSIGVSQGT